MAFKILFRWKNSMQCILFLFIQFHQFSGCMISACTHTVDQCERHFAAITELCQRFHVMLLSFESTAAFQYQQQILSGLFQQIYRAEGMTEFPDRCDPWSDIRFFLCMKQPDQAIFRQWKITFSAIRQASFRSPS